MGALLPVIDLRAWRTGDPLARRSLAAAVDAACSEIGFFQLVGHGIPAGVISAMRASTDAFFALPLAEKLELVPERPGLNRGYAPQGSEALAYSLGFDAPAPDLFEAFNIGPDPVPRDAFYANAPHDFFAPNLWPVTLPTLRPALRAYFAAAVDVALTLTDVFALALGLEERWFRPFVERSTLTLRVNHYQRHPGDGVPVPGQMRMGAHTDYGVVTVLYADPVPGLEIMGLDSTWHSVIPAEGALLVNLGDITAEWTNDRWRSTIHRVVPPPRDEHGVAKRRSVALFLDGNYDAVIECLPTCTAPDRPPRYPKVTAGEHLIAKLLGPRTLSRSSAMNTAKSRIKEL